jgi:NitT/TauT family transport system permease protein
MTREGWIRLFVVVASIALLEAVCRLGLVSATVIISPTEMALSLWRILASGELNEDIFITFRNVVAAAAVSIALGFTLGVIIHLLPRLRRAIEPLLASYYAIPTFMFYPVFIIVFGVGSVAITVIAVLLALVGMITATLNGLDRIPAVLRKTARILRMSLPARALLVDLPAAAPHHFTGVKLSVAYSFIGVIASEFILSGSGIGYSIAYAYNNFNNRKMYGLMLLVIVAATVVNATLDVIDRRMQARLSR